MRQFAEKYGNITTETLSRHFSKPIFANNHNKPLAIYNILE
jgi:hypothetical protein